MKKTLLISIFLIFSLNLFSQSIIKNEIDKFTKERIITTSRERLFIPSMKVSTDLSYQFAATIPEESTQPKYVMALFICRYKVFSIHEGDNIYILLQDGEVIKAPSAFSKVSDTGLGRAFVEGEKAQCIAMYFDFEDYDWISADNPIKDIRIETAGSLIDVNIKIKHALNLCETFSLLKSEVAKF